MLQNEIVHAQESKWRKLEAISNAHGSDGQDVSATYKMETPASIPLPSKVSMASSFTPIPHQRAKIVRQQEHEPPKAGEIAKCPDQRRLGASQRYIFTVCPDSSQ